MEIKTIINDLFTHVSGRELNEEELTSTAEAFVKIGARRKREVMEVFFFQYYYKVNFQIALR